MPREVQLRWMLGFLALVVLSLVGCGGNETWPEASYAQSGASPAPQAAGLPSPEAPAPMLDSGDAYDADESFGEGLDSKAQGKGGRPETAPYDPTPSKARPAAPLVVYSGYLKLQVRRLLESIDQITKATEKRAGYIESLTSNVVVVRVPGKDFEGVMAEFAELGEVLDQNIRAEDVTEQFTDVGARLAVAREARTRLLTLLEQEKDMKQRLAVLQEIKRLTEQIELMESTLATLQNLVDYFTITLELVPILENSRAAVYVSPFSWVRDLSPHQATLLGGKEEFSLGAPKGFVVFDEDDEFRAQSSDTAMLRAATIENEPVGDAAFWSEAVRHEMLARGEKALDRGTKGVVSYEIFVNDDLKPRYYLVGVAVRGTDLFVIEAFFPNRASYETHGAALTAALATFRPE